MSPFRHVGKAKKQAKNAGNRHQNNGMSHPGPNRNKSGVSPLERRKSLKGKGRLASPSDKKRMPRLIKVSRSNLPHREAISGSELNAQKSGKLADF